MTPLIVGAGAPALPASSAEAYNESVESPAAKTTVLSLMVAPDDVLLGDPDIVELLREESERRRRANRNFRAFCWIGITLLALGEIWHWARTGNLDAGFLAPLALIAGGVAVGANKALASAIKGAAPLRDVRSLGPMLEVLDAGDPQLAAIATECIVELLPQVDEASWGGLETAHRLRLEQMLKRSANPRDARAIASALARFGGLDTVPVLEGFCGGSTALKGADKDRVIGQTRMDLADLRLRLARQRIDSEIEAAERRTTS